MKMEEKFISDNNIAGIADRVAGLAADILPGMDLELLEVQFRREQPGWILRLFIDTSDPESGVSLDHCTKVSRELGDILDVEDFISQPYQLEISSPGLERKLVTREHFIRFCGNRIKIRLHEALNNQKTLYGELVSVKDDTLTLKMDDGSRGEFTFDMINSARLTL